MPPTSPEPRLMPQVTCPHCGARFDCRPDGDCWCFAETGRLPLPAGATPGACLCPGCLRSAAATVR